MIELEYNLHRRDEDENQLDRLRDCDYGLILNGSFVEDEEPASWQRPAYEMI